MILEILLKILNKITLHYITLHKYNKYNLFNKKYNLKIENVLYIINYILYLL